MVVEEFFYVECFDDFESIVKNGKEYESCVDWNSDDKERYL